MRGSQQFRCRVPRQSKRQKSVSQDSVEFGMANRMETNGMKANERPLSDRTMLVTGAAKRLGRAIALAAAERGADVAITYRESAREARTVIEELAALGVNGLAVRCDVTDEKSVREMVKEVARELGRN